MIVGRSEAALLKVARGRDGWAAGRVHETRSWGGLRDGSSRSVWERMLLEAVGWWRWRRMEGPLILFRRDAWWWPEAEAMAWRRRWEAWA